MKRKKWIVAAVLGLVAGSAHLAYVRGLENEARGGGAVEVLATTKRVAVGQKIVEDVLATRQVPESYVDDRVVRADKASEAIGLVAAVDLESGQMVQWTDFVERADQSTEDLARVVESGQRAITIPVDGALSMGGMLRPGHRVDILGTFSRGEKWTSSERVTVTLLQNVLVLATGRDLQGDEKEGGVGRFTTVTLSASLEEAELLSFATTQGKLSLVLRGRQDLSVVRDVPEKGMSDVWEAERRNALQEKPKRRAEPVIERLKAR
ncbi:MAG: Flp pilus assembly protein CpaB [Deltaproteobacteria bacterium]|nr:Flp pilus assembly protein CpaB [Deltaproteobacteria bacterium]